MIFERIHENLIPQKFPAIRYLRNQRGHPTKLGVHKFDINPYLHELFELILFDSIFCIEVCVCVCVCVCIMYLFFLFDKVFLMWLPSKYLVFLLLFLHYTEATTTTS